MRDIIKNINYYKSRSAEKLQSEQASYIPYLEPNQIECTVNNYIMAGKRYIMNHYEHICFRLRYLKFRPNTYRNRERYNNTNTSMIELVEKKIIQPFALFINGRFIPWDIISISISADASHIIVNISELDGKFKDLAVVKYAQILTLPEYANYSISGEYLDYDVLCSFNDIGLFDAENPTYSLIMEKTPHVCTSYISTIDSVNAVDISESFTDIEGGNVRLEKIKLSKENVLLFVNGYFSIGEKKNIVRGLNWDYMDEDYKDFAPKIEFVKSDEDLGTNPDIEFNSMNLTINNGQNVNSDKYDIIIYANELYSNSIDHVSGIDNKFVQSMVQSKNNGEAVPEYFDQLNESFKLSMDKDLDYNTNIVNAIKTMLKYNSNSFQETFKRTSNLEITEYTGEWVNKTTREDNTLWIPRRHNYMNEEFIIMLVNGKLYKYDHAIKYRANYCIIPITDISDTDKIEFLRFKNINNFVSDIVINADDGFVNYSTDIINENMILFSDKPFETDPYTYPKDGDQHFPVNYKLEVNDSGLIKIILENEYYYGKPLKVAYKNRYVHRQYVVNDNQGTAQYSINLKNYFAYCNDYTKFLIFHNGHKLDSSLYRLVLPTRTTTPFYEFKLYFSIPIEIYDTIDIIYAPSLMKDIVYIPETDISGSIVVDKQILNYGIGSELFMVWINGKKIPASSIRDISSNRMHIMTDELSTKNLTITKYIPDIEVLINDFHTEVSDWDSIISKLTNEEIYQMLGINPTGLTDQELDIYDGSIDIKTIMYELIREQYMMNPRVDITGNFVYDYSDIDQTIVEEHDKFGNILFNNVADANREDNVKGTPWSISKEE